ncbi:ATP/GTP-binding protein [Aspergillus stella-maris]|uniref:ATP/GTP-binding protein n=1 Tax=Aspergillus stella-maris TaxID=1810926 RepID=UPI003CCE43D1
MQPISLYIIGAQCTGKTTLVRVLQEAISKQHPSLHLKTISEVARHVLQKHQFTRDDIAYNPPRALELQQLILAAQYAEENSPSPTDVVLSDRSGVDPIVYAINYGPPQSRDLLEDSSEWHYLRDRMRKALVILCPPQQEWLKDDGTRLMSSTMAEWEHTHSTFIQVLEENEIPFQAIPRELTGLGERVEFVLRTCTGLWEENSLQTLGVFKTGIVKELHVHAL